jgi:2-C-methyl-D-erythritol 4-phosphate cytidylyltransferase
MSESLSAVVVAAGRSQRMGFDKLLTLLAGRPLLLHTLERLFLTEAPREIVLVVRPGSEMEMHQVIAPLGRRDSIRIVPGGAQRRDSVQNGLQAVSPDSEFVMVHDAARPFVTRELIDTVLAAAKISDAAVCGAPCSDSLKEVGEDGLVLRTVDRSRLWTVQTPQIFRTQLLRDAYRGALVSGTIFTDDTAVVEAMGHPVRIVLYHGINLKVTTPMDWKIAEVFLAGDGGAAAEAPGGAMLRKHLHDMNNHLTPLMGYAFLLNNELQNDEKLKKFSGSIQTASERCQATTAAMQKIVRELFPNRGE